MLNKDLRQRVDEVLHCIWDPIGVSGVPEARDEYAGYVLPVVGLLNSGESAETIAKYLFDVVTDRMGLTGNLAHDREVAEVLTNWAEVLREPNA